MIDDEQTTTGDESPAGLMAEVASEVIGRRREIEDIAAALGAGRDLLLEGPPGTSKSTLLRAVGRASGTPLVFVEGNADLTPAKLSGYHNPAAVMQHGYRTQDFVPGPLVDAMRRGALLYIEEFNRVPDDTLNLLLGPLAERKLEVPRVGLVRASPGFRLIAAMNPFDDVGTLRVSQSIHDRLCRLVIGYQSEAEEREIVRVRSGSTTAWLIEGAVALVRATRAHDDIRMGASVRGAIDLVLVAGHLAPLRGVSLDDADNAAKDLVLDATLLALSGRILLADAAERSPEAILRELWENVFYFIPQAARGTFTLDLDNPIGAPLARPPRPHGGPIVRPLVPKDKRVPQPKAGKVTEAPRVYRPDELQMLSVERSARAMPLSPRELLRDHPAARDLLRDDDTFDLEAFRELYARDQEEGLALLGALWPAASDEMLRELTRRLALRIVMKLARRDPTANPGKGKLRPVRYRFNSDDLDLDRTLEEIAGKAYPEYDDFWVMERVRARQAYVLLLDVSGSMNGLKLMHAALAAGSLARNIREDDFGVVLFWRDAAVLKGETQEKPLARLLDDILAIRARGLTNLRLGLEVGLRELTRSPAQEKIGILFTDGMHNLGDDPLPMAARYSRLHVIGTSLDESRVQACQELAAQGHGRCVFIQSVDDIAPAISVCMSA